MNIVQQLKAWRERRHWQRRHMEFVRVMVQTDYRWLASIPVADRLTTRYLMALDPEHWMKTSFADVSVLRAELQILQQAQIDAVVLAEREECAKVADGLDCAHRCGVGGEVGSAIRARGQS